MNKQVIINYDEYQELLKKIKKYEESKMIVMIIELGHYSTSFSYSIKNKDKYGEFKKIAEDVFEKYSIQIESKITQEMIDKKLKDKNNLIDNLNQKIKELENKIPKKKKFLFF